MACSSSCVQWPYFIVKVKNFHKLTRVVKSNCAFQNLTFNLILEEECFPREEDNCFKMYIEVTSKSNQEMSEAKVCFAVKTYILGKLEEMRCLVDGYVDSSDAKKTHTVWKLKRNTLMESYGWYKQMNGEVCLVCHFQPTHLPDISNPEILYPKSYSKSQTYLFVWNSTNNLSKDFESFFENSKGDLLLKSGNFQAFVDRNIIIKRCRNFGKEILKLETAVSEFEVPELDTDTLAIFLRYVYSGKIPDISTDHAQRLFTFGSKYHMADLTNLCALIMAHGATEENALDFLLFAQEHDHKNLRHHIISYILDKNILKSQSWPSFSTRNKKLALAVYQESVKMSSI